MSASGLGKLLLAIAAVLALAGGILVLLGGRVPFGRLPGDLTIRRGNFRLGIPLATSLLISVVLTIVLNLVLRRR